MNETKKTLILISGILSIVEGVSLFFVGLFFLLNVGYFNEVIAGTGVAENPFPREVFIGMGAIFVILAIMGVVGGVLLMKSISNPYKFAEKRSTYITGCVLTIIASGGLSIPAILLYIAFALKTEPGFNVNYPEEKLEEQKPKPTGDIKRQLDILRDMKERGELTSDEFKQAMLELIKK